MYHGTGKGSASANKLEKGQIKRSDPFELLRTLNEADKILLDVGKSVVAEKSGTIVHCDRVAFGTIGGARARHARSDPLGLSTADDSFINETVITIDPFVQIHLWNFGTRHWGVSERMYIKTLFLRLFSHVKSSGIRNTLGWMFAAYSLLSHMILAILAFRISTSWSGVKRTLASFVS